MEEEYTVKIQPSARRANSRTGKLVHASGVIHKFSSREAADGWARRLSERGGRKVWIRDANPWDGSEVDGYLVSRRPEPVDSIETPG